MEYQYLSDTVEVKTVEESDTEGTFHIEGLYTGYGTTIANSLRRTLLSSIPGSAISKVKVKDVEHEFETIDGMKEDVVEFTLNLKEVSFDFNADEPQVLKLQAEGETEVTAGDIESSSLVEVVNPDVHLATLTEEDAELDAEVTVEKGLGYVPSDTRESEERLPIGTIMLDTVFSPVLNVAFDVEDMRVGERTDYNRIKMTIETDGSISPSAALRKASRILEDHFEVIADTFTEDTEEEEEEPDEEDEEGEE